MAWNNRAYSVIALGPEIWNQVQGFTTSGVSLGGKESFFPLPASSACYYPCDYVTWISVSVFLWPSLLLSLISAQEGITSVIQDDLISRYLTYLHLKIFLYNKITLKFPEIRTLPHLFQGYHSNLSVSGMIITVFNFQPS